MTQLRPMPPVGRRFFYTMRSEGAGVVRESMAIGIGMFIGCLPLYGLHLGLCIATGWLLGLNRLKMYLAANVSNPVMAPLLLFSELQVGSLLRRGRFHDISIEAARTTGVATFGADLIVGSIAVGTLLGVTAGLVTFLSVRQSIKDAAFLDLVRATSERYVTASITAWEFARGKLRSDAVYRLMVCGGVLPGGERLLDLGCGSGLMLALLAEARSRVRAGIWASSLGPPPLYEWMTGIDIRPRVVEVAREALGDDAQVFVADARELPSHTYDTVLICDVLHMIPFEQQERLLDAARRSLRSGGVLIVRDADAAAGWRFRAVRIGNALKAAVLGYWKQRFYFRSEQQWTELFARTGLTVTALPGAEGTPFANVVFRLTSAPVSSAITQTPAHAG